MNVLTTPALRNFRSELAAAIDDPTTRAIAVLGREDAFSAGLDRETPAKGGVAAQELLVEMGELLLDLYGGRAPVVAGCGGHAVAAGAMLLLASDRRIGAQGSYRVGFSEVPNGMPLPELPLLLARDRLDPRRLQESTLLGVLWEPAQAVAAGFLDLLVPAQELEDEVSRQARELALLPANAYSESIPSVRGATLARMRDSMARERERLASLQREV